jgi:DNA-binding PadR family transcriptional regulator
MKGLTRKEELIMLSILNLEKNAYLVAIADHLSKITRKKVSLTSVHLPLGRLEEAGLIESDYGKSTSVRGGRRKKIYKITSFGFRLLEEHKRISDTLWSGYLKEFFPED